MSKSCSISLSLGLQKVLVMLVMLQYLHRREIPTNEASLLSIKASGRPEMKTANLAFTPEYRPNGVHVWLQRCFPWKAYPWRFFFGITFELLLHVFPFIYICQALHFEDDMRKWRGP